MFVDEITEMFFTLEHWFDINNLNNKSQQHTRFRAHWFHTLWGFFCVFFLNFLTLKWRWIKVMVILKSKYRAYVYHHTKFESNWFINVQMHGKIYVFGCCKSAVIESGCSAWTASKPYQISSRWNVCKKMKPTGFALCWPCESQGQGH